MKIRFIYTILVFTIVITSKLPLSAQIISTATPKLNKVSIGDIVEVDLYAKIPTSITAKGISFSGYKDIRNLSYAADSLTHDATGDIEILDYGKWAVNDIDQVIDFKKIELIKESGFLSLRNTIKIAIYNHGQFEIPPLTIVADSLSELVKTQGVLLTVMLPPKLMQSDSLDINPIKDIIPEPKKWVDYLWIAWILLGIGALFFIWRWFKNRPKNKTITVVNNPLAHEMALRALDKLKEEKIWLQGHHKDFQTQLTDVMRIYLFDRFNISAQKLTSSQIIAALNKIGMAKDLCTEMDQILDIADLVKFAKAEPGVDIHAQFLDRAIAFVHQTKVVN